MPPRLSNLNTLILLLLVAHNDILEQIGCWTRRIPLISSCSRNCNIIVCEAFVVAVFQPRVLGGSAYSGNNEDHKSSSSFAVRSFGATSLSNGFTSGGGSDDDEHTKNSPVSDETSQRIAINRAYIATLENNLHKVLDEWILNGNRVLVSIAF
jgi:hypothetical protein